MAKTTQLRVHLIAPKDSPDSVREHFYDLFYTSDERIFYPEDDLDTRDVFVSDIIEDREDQRSDIQKLHSFIQEEFPNHDVFYTERNSPRNREENPALDYSKDVVIGVCNGESSSPQIRTRITIDGLKTGNTESCPIFDNVYVTFVESESNEGYDLIGIDLQRAEIIWREFIQKSKGSWSNPTRCDSGILLSTGSHDLRLHNVENGDEKWRIEFPYEPEGNIYLRNTSPVSAVDQAFIGGGDGNIYQISLLDGTFETLGDYGEAVYELEYDANSGTIIALLGPGSEKRSQAKYNWDDDEKPTMEYHLASISADDGEVLWKHDLGEIKRRGAAEIAVGGEAIYFAPYNGSLASIEPKSGEINWQIDQDELSDTPNDSSSTRFRTSALTPQLSVSSLIASREAIFASTNKGLLRISIDDGEIEWVQEHSSILTSYNDTIVCKEGSTLLNAIVGVDEYTGKQSWKFEMIGNMGGINSYGSDLVLASGNECLVIDTELE